MSSFDIRRQESGPDTTGLPESPALDLTPGEHLCLFYDDPTEQAPALVPFLKQGLEIGECVIYIADDSTTGKIRSGLRDSGVDIEAKERSGALRLWSREHWQEPGHVDSDQKAELVRKLAREAHEEGYPGVRFGIEMTWPFDGELDSERLFDWEAAINTIFEPGLNARIICQYSTRRLKTEALHAALRAHPTAIIGADVRPNPYYEAPIILRGGSDAARIERLSARAEPEQAAGVQPGSQGHAPPGQDDSAGDRGDLEEIYRLTDEASERLRVASAAKDEFLALISHELRTPLTMILGNAEVLYRHGDSLDQHERAAAIEDLHVEARRLSSIIEHLLIVSRVENGDPLETEPVLPARVLAPIVARFRQEHGRSVTVSGDAGIAAWGTRKSVSEVLENLVGNAHKYSALLQPIEIRISRAPGECIVSVSDRGIGILDDELDHLFEPFYRSPRVAATQVRGLGVGLAACRRMIEAHRGRIWAEQRPGGGSVFSFALPLAELKS